MTISVEKSSHSLLTKSVYYWNVDYWMFCSTFHLMIAAGFEDMDWNVFCCSGGWGETVVLLELKHLLGFSLKKVTTNINAQTFLPLTLPK